MSILISERLSDHTKANHAGRQAEITGTDAHIHARAALQSADGANVLRLTRKGYADALKIRRFFNHDYVYVLRLCATFDN
jgi:hypothetical protein